MYNCISDLEDDHQDDTVLFMRRYKDINRSLDEDMWDDSVLIQAYDRAVNLAKEEVAKRIAMDTQSRQKFQDSKCPNQPKKLRKKWTVRDPCRAVYSEDGEVYEAIILHIDESADDCTVEFVGYRNRERVKLSSLLESEGDQSQTEQQKQAFIANEGDTDSEPYIFVPSNPHHKPTDFVYDYDTDTDTMIRRQNLPYKKYFRKSIPVRESEIKPPNCAMPPPPPLPPNCAMPPPPPLPPQLMAKLPETDTDALSSMLMSWYISGFHTGYYHGLKQAKINQEKRGNCQ
ncbi:survival motor neuron protein [Linepithema humile]|uniref:survival motor neuron protein n=1 Tax=Linepithema humile TaxID=83485 RepID=UPI00062380FD|nr:PREDICTED: survival motor neuron protein [Linepithema humile]